LDQNFVARQFIVLVKKLRKELRKSLSDLRDALKNQTEAIRQYYQAAEQAQDAQSPIQISAELHTPEDVERRRTSNEDRQYRLQRWNTVGTWLAFFAVAIYAAITYFQLRDFDESIGISQIIARQARMQAAASNRNAVAAEVANRQSIETDRPWFGAVLVGVEGFEVDKIPVATVLFTNSGKRPAKVIIAQTNSHWFHKFPDNPPYEYKTRSTNVIVPNVSVINKFNTATRKLTQVEIDTATAGTTARYFIYGNIQYVDIRTGIEHYTHACWSYIGNEPALAKGFYNCNEYEDAN
jgi:hypothetical protein